MKNIFIISIILTIITSSCYVTKYTHSEVMNMSVTNQTKDGILKKFGIPSQKKSEGSYEEWIYDLGQRTIVLGLPSTSNTKINVNPSYNSADLRTNRYGGGAISSTYNNYIKITFQNSTAIKWETQGVDYTVTENKPGATALLVIGTIGTSVLLALLLASAIL
jgi:hypothetical protein